MSNDAQKANTAAGWIRVADFLPSEDDGTTYVWVTFIGAQNFPRPPATAQARYHAQLGWQPAGCQGWDWIVTHWMPLPDPALPEGGHQ